MVNTRNKKKDYNPPDLVYLIKCSRKGRRGRTKKNVLAQADDTTFFRYYFFMTILVCLMFWSFGHPFVVVEDGDRKHYIPFDLDAKHLVIEAIKPKKKDKDANNKKKKEFKYMVKKLEFTHHEPVIFFEGRFI